MQQPQLIQPFVPGIAFHRDRDTAPATVNRQIAGRGGNFVWIPRGTVHLFTVTSQLCRALNGYTPAGFEQVIIGLADPAERRELPPPKGKPDQVTIDKVFNNYWCAEAKDDWSLSRMGMR